MFRIVIADDNEDVRRYVHEALEDDEAWKVCAEAGTGREAVRLTKELQPDLVVLDLSMPDGNGIDATREIHKHFPAIPILILTMHHGPELSTAAVAAGARACLLKSDLNSLLDAVRICAAGMEISNGIH
jgi:DNA-binding NarL/FixJ family response regulator